MLGRNVAINTVHLIWEKKMGHILEKVALAYKNTQIRKRRVTDDTHFHIALLSFRIYALVLY